MGQGKSFFKVVYFQPSAICFYFPVFWSEKSLKDLPGGSSHLWTCTVLHHEKGEAGELRGGETEETLAYDETGLDLTGHINKKSMNKPYSPGIPFHDHHRPLKQSLGNLCAISELEL